MASRSPFPLLAISQSSHRWQWIAGTTRRGGDEKTDRKLTEALLADPKEAAEHATITDLIRNDLSRFATEVTVTRYRYLDELHTHRGPLLQMSSEIRGRLPEDYPSRLGDLFFSLLPAGSITGAPKPRTVQIIR